MTQDWNRVVDAVKTRPPNEVARDITVLRAESGAQWQDIEKALAVCTQTRVLALLNDVQRAKKLMTAVRALPLTHFAVIDLVDTEIKYLPRTLTHLSVWYYTLTASDFPSAVFESDLNLPAILKQCPNLTHLYVKCDSHHTPLDARFTKMVNDAMATLPPSFKVFILNVSSGELWGDAETSAQNLAAIAAKDRRFVLRGSFLPFVEDQSLTGEDSGSSGEDSDSDGSGIDFAMEENLEVEGLLPQELTRDDLLDWGAGWNDDASLWKVAERFVESRNL